MAMQEWKVGVRGLIGIKTYKDAQGNIYRKRFGYVGSLTMVESRPDGLDGHYAAKRHEHRRRGQTLTFGTPRRRLA